MTNETTIATMPPAEDAQHTIPSDVMEKVVIGGDLSELNAAQRADYYTAVCRSLGLNPLTKPFEFLTLNGKLRLYALRDCAGLCRKFCSGGAEGTVAPVGGVIRRPGHRTVRPE
jgi:hypothetical protein